MGRKIPPLSQCWSVVSLPPRQIAIESLHSVLFLNRFLQQLANFGHFILSLEVGDFYARRFCVGLYGVTPRGGVTSSGFSNFGQYECVALSRVFNVSSSVSIPLPL